ncbi:ATP-binding cassette domain-containing protein [Tundrisphaera lichenicola]|uniref:ATP-binding cassette domain-containing protein n=1 Tax=Tundrisphaera lichenicola TaxID=2029860 RepID=UPI003EB785BC
MPLSPEAIVSWLDVRKSFDDGHIALDGVSLEVQRGEFLAILGTSGSGKTTLLKLVNRLIDPTSGAVLVGGKPTTEWDPIALRRSMGYVIQESGLMPHLTILANVGLVLRLIGVKRSEREEAARRCLSMVGIDPEQMGERLPHQLSGGQRQRVGVARALAADPELILMDEPFGALDPITRREIQNEFRNLQRNLGKTVILVTHDLREACRMADRLALVDRGQVVQVGCPSDFLDQPANDFVRSFFQDARAVTAIDGESQS